MSLKQDVKQDGVEERTENMSQHGSEVKYFIHSKTQVSPKYLDFKFAKGHSKSPFASQGSFKMMILRLLRERNGVFARKRSLKVKVIEYSNTRNTSSVELTLGDKKHKIFVTVSLLPRRRSEISAAQKFLHQNKTKRNA